MAAAGFRAELLPRLFEPFFTTKAPGKGTGLGLATVDRIARQRGGWMRVTSEFGRGTTFMLYLPAMVSMALFAANGADRLAALGGKETILVVDDNVAVRQVACRSLRRIGCHVLKASSGEEALAVGVTSEVRIDLLLTDLIMPGSLNGRQLVQQLRAHRPELPVFFSSGYAADVLGRDFVATDRERWLAKPYNPMLLARAVRGALDGEDLDH